MRIWVYIICIELLIIFVIIGCLRLLHTNLSIVLQTTYNGGPPPIDPNPLNYSRRINARDTHSLINVNNDLQQPNIVSSSRFIFMSCNRQKMFNPFWKIISLLEPNVIIWMGDNIYADHPGAQYQVAIAIIQSLIISPIYTLRALWFRSVPLFPPAEPLVIQDAYKQTLQHLEYRQVLQGRELQLVTGVWDDHDYGVNDGDKTYQHRDESKQYLLDFLNVSSNDIRRSPKHEGIFGVEYIEIPRPSRQHNKKPLKIAIILLDLRYNKDSWTMNRDIADFLGISQWSWFELLLNKSDADVHLIISSIQVLVDQRSFLESWSGFPNARRRLLNTVLRSGAKNPVFLSGDVHFAEVGTMNCRPTRATTKSLGIEVPDLLQLWEFTSSGMTHAARRVAITGVYLDLAVRWLLSTEHIDTRKTDGIKQLYTGRNIGVLDVLVTENSTSKEEDNLSTILSFKILNSKSEITLFKDLVVRETSRWLTPYEWNSNISLTNPLDQKWKSIEWTCDPITGPVSPNRIRLGVQLVFLSLLSFVLFLSLLVVLLFQCFIAFYRNVKSSGEKPKKD